jgi:hypothetical protein
MMKPPYNDLGEGGVSSRRLAESDIVSILDGAAILASAQTFPVETFGSHPIHRLKIVNSASDLGVSSEDAIWVAPFELVHCLPQLSGHAT